MTNHIFRAGDSALLRVKVAHVFSDHRHANVDLGSGNLAYLAIVLVKDLLRFEVVRPGAPVRWSGSEAIYRVVAISEQHSQAWVELNGRYQTARVRDLEPVTGDGHE